MDGFIKVAAIVGPLVGVVIGALLTQHWQRKKWILDNKAAEYRGIFDALNALRFEVTTYYAKYKFAQVVVPAQKQYDDKIAFAKAVAATSNAFADRIFTRLAVEKCAARRGWNELAGKLGKEAPFEELDKMMDDIHGKLVRAVTEDLKIKGFCTRIRRDPHFRPLSEER